MPKFYFDVQCGDEVTPDLEGQSFPNRQAAAIEAVAILPDVARGLLWGDGSRLSINVRNDFGHIYTATLLLFTRWLDS